ncbi:hypothetical protein JTE90_027120 [Oedothorax gibbosus]|uniref:Uncharacterized protein n=1 Tax=Oedothorax gibbosus TaxID=931172 RepID=A0AAV6U1D8_9ARAC|nr:hypothetical protein JTE90_027120 [Oedothorax gibbosus]
MPEPSIVPELVETVPSNLPENTEHLENIDSPSETDNLVERMSLRSLTSSRKIINIIHRYGHCISYSAIEELETEATYTSVQKSESCPETIVKSPHLCTGVAFDNFDRFVETKSGKDTLHDTVGIIYQNIDLHTPDESQFVNLPASNNEMHLNSNKRRQRTFEAVTVDVREEPFAKKRRMMWPNYARWTSKHYDSLMNVAETHPKLFDEFQKGLFGIQRTDKPYSKQPIDLVLEQTINADAARRLTGIMQFTNSISARQRWALSHDIRSTIISYVNKYLDLQKEQDVTTELTNHNIKNNIRQLQKFIDTFHQFINPFDAEVPKDFLINISSGKAASEPVEKFLLNIEENGEIKRKTFITECEQQDDGRLEKSIKKTLINNFSIDYAKKRKTKLGGNVQEVRVQRDFFGCILGISIDNKVDMAKIFVYPITPVPLSLCHFDGAISYNLAGITDVDAARLQQFINNYMVYDVNEEFNRENVKSFNASNLPPCKRELLQQFRRANYITSLWINSYKKELRIFSPENNGWTLEDNHYNFN